MGLPRIRIWTLMVVVVVVAMDCLALRSRPWGLPMVGIAFVLGAVPMATILAVTLLWLGPRRTQDEATRRFLLGFQVVGWVAMIVFLAACQAAPFSVMDYVQWTLPPILAVVRRAGLARPVVSSVNHVLALFFFATHPFLLALLAGWTLRLAPLASSRTRGAIAPSAPGTEGALRPVHQPPPPE